MSIPLRVLMVEDSPDDALILLRELGRAGYDALYERVETGDAFQAALNRQKWDLVVADWHLPGFSGPAALLMWKQAGLDIPFLILSGVVSEAEAVAAMKAGAHDYIRKGNPARLIPAIERELREAEMRRRNRQLEESARQSETIDMIGRFAAHVAAEFKETLVRISGSAAALMAILADHGPGRKEVENIQEAAHHASLLTLQLAALSQSRGSRCTAVDVNAVISAGSDTLRRILGKAVRLSTSLEPSLGKVMADRSQIEQLVLNLVANARETAGQNGKILIETANTELDENYIPQSMEIKPGKYVALWVRDSGRGIERRARARIFEPFYTGLPRGRDTGLSMTLVYNIVRQNGGDIRVESEPGKGTAFTVYLPRVEEVEARAEAVEAPAAAPVAAAGAGTVLLVEDDEASRGAVRDALAGAGHAVLEARDGRTARLIDRNFAAPIHLLLTTVMLSDMSGSDLAGEMAQTRPGLKVLFSCACTDPSEALIRSGRLVVDKHGPVQELVEKVRLILSEQNPAVTAETGDRR